MSNATEAMNDFCTDKGITVRVKKVDSNKYMPDFEGDHWNVVLSKDGKTIATPYSKGSGHKGVPPDAGEVIANLCMDSYYVDMTFDEFCNELGYDSDSRKAEKTYLNVVRSGKKFVAFMGDDLEEAQELSQDY